jgi:hypothetical protein
MKNAGVTPATLRAIHESFQVAHTLRHIQPAKRDEARFKDITTVIPPNSLIGVGGSFCQQLNDEEVQTLNAGGSVFFHGILMYQDIFDKWRYLGFGFRTIDNCII